MSEHLKFENIYCVGRNFEGHAKELGNKVPTSPLIFQKSNSAVNVKETIEIPKNKTIEHELEIVLMIGKEGVPKNQEEARTFISGFSIGLDLTDRDLQSELKKKGLPWFASKSFKGSAVIDTNFRHECPNEFYLNVNQKIRQEGNLKDMIFPFEDIVLHLSKIVDLKKGDIIFTGTPEGVGPLESGDEIEMGFKNYSPKKLFVV
jgi:acylpyruvate hydrolase